MPSPTLRNETYIRATPEQIWEAITTPEFTQRYFFGSHVTVTPSGPAGSNTPSA